MAVMKLTEQSVSALAATGKQYLVWDDELKGFGVRVSQAGTKTYILRYTLDSGRDRWKKLGRVGAVPLVKARKFAKDDIGVAARGGDPLTAKDNAREAITVKAALARFMAEHVEVKRAAKTVTGYQQVIDSELAPRLGAFALADIGQPEVMKLHFQMRATPVQANRAVAVLSSMIGWSMKMGLIPVAMNPCKAVGKNPERKRKVYLDADQYARLGKVLLRKRDAVVSSRLQRVALELLILTGARPVEIASLQWPFITYLPDGTGRIVLPEHKTDETAGDKTIFIPPAGVALLKSWPRFAHSPYVFPGQGRGKKKGVHLHPDTLSDAWAKLRKAADLPGVRLYDACRHSYASHGISVHNLTLKQIGGQLGHSQPSTTDRYAHLHDKVARDQAKLVGGSIARALRKRA